MVKALIKSMRLRTLPLSLIFCALMVGYYALLTYVN